MGGGQTPLPLPSPADLHAHPCEETRGNSSKRRRAGDRRLQLFVLNEEFLVSARHQRALNSSLLFVHTARRCYRSNGLVSIREGSAVGVALAASPVPERLRTVSFRGSKSRNKVSVGEPADGSLVVVSAAHTQRERKLVCSVCVCVSFLLCVEGGRRRSALVALPAATHFDLWWNPCGVAYTPRYSASNNLTPTLCVPSLDTPAGPACFALTASRGVSSTQPRTTVDNGYLGSRNDEERSEMRNVM